MTEVDTGRTDAGVPPFLRRWGAMGWAVAGIALGIVALFLGFRLLSGIIVPAAFALILAVLLRPLTDWLNRHMPRGWAVGIVLLLFAGACVLLGVIFVRGVANEAPEITAALQGAVQQLQDALGVTSSGVSSSVSSNTAAASSVVTTGGLGGLIIGGIDSAISLFFGLFVGAMVLFLVLLTPSESQGWLARLLPWPVDQSRRLFAVSGQVVLDYYKGCTILAFVNAVPIWIVALVMDIPAAGAIFVVLFVSSYIPYVGAWIGGAFAVLLALGSGGTSEGWIMLAAVLIVNLGLQSAVQPFAFSATMKVSPLGVFLATLLGAVLAGVLGAMMAAPVMALLTRFAAEVEADPAAVDPVAAAPPGPATG